MFVVPRLCWLLHMLPCLLVSLVAFDCVFNMLFQWLWVEVIWAPPGQFPSAFPRLLRVTVIWDRLNLNWGLRFSGASRSVTAKLELLWIFIHFCFACPCGTLRSQPIAMTIYLDSSISPLGTFIYQNSVRPLSRLTCIGKYCPTNSPQHPAFLALRFNFSPNLSLVILCSLVCSLVLFKF